MMTPKLGNGIGIDIAIGIGILHLSSLLVPLFRYRIGSCIGIFVHITVPDLTGCRTVRHSGI
jgi:hypothetical protein